MIRAVARLARDERIIDPRALGAVSLSLGVVTAHALHIECPFRASTGWDCPVCGATRAFEALGCGRPFTALHDNAAALVVALTVGVLSIPRIGKLTVARRSKHWAMQTSPWVWVGLLVTWTLLRNAPGLLWLAPDR